MKKKEGSEGVLLISISHLNLYLSLSSLSAFYISKILYLVEIKPGRNMDTEIDIEKDIYTEMEIDRYIEIDYWGKKVKSGDPLVHSFMGAVKNGANIVHSSNVEMKK